MRATILAVLALVAVLVWAAVSTSAPCTSVPDKYGLDCSTSATSVIVIEETPSGCAFPATFPCTME